MRCHAHEECVLFGIQRFPSKLNYYSVASQGSKSFSKNTSRHVRRAACSDLTQKQYLTRPLNEPVNLLSLALPPHKAVNCPFTVSPGAETGKEKKPS